jgi:hypothetical protein
MPTILSDTATCSIFSTSDFRSAAWIQSSDFKVLLDSIASVFQHLAWSQYNNNGFIITRSITCLAGQMQGTSNLEDAGGD